MNEEPRGDLGWEVGIRGRPGPPNLMLHDREVSSSNKYTIFHNRFIQSVLATMRLISSAHIIERML
jgi:hypothetical protein